MIKMVIGNLLFIGILFGWYLYTDGDTSLLLSGVILGFTCFICGIFMGYILHTPPKLRSAAPSPPAAAFVHPIEEQGELEHEPMPAPTASVETNPEHDPQAEPEMETPSPEIAIAENHSPEPEPSGTNVE